VRKEVRVGQGRVYVNIVLLAPSVRGQTCYERNEPLNEVNCPFTRNQ
jgi:hypothetical protein